RLNVDPDQLNVNLADGRNSLEFTADYSNITKGSSSTKVKYTLYYKNPTTGEYVSCTDDFMQMTVTMDNVGEVTGPIGSSFVEHSLWKYNTNGTVTTAEITVNSSNSGSTNYGTATIEIKGGKIETVTLNAGANALKDDYTAIIEMILKNNGIPNSFTSLTLEQAAVVSAIETALAGVRADSTKDDGTGSSALKLEVTSDKINSIPEGNYKLVGELQLHDVTVAKDFFIFNVNRSTRFEPIQESNPELLKPESGTEP
ncbi:MAG: hypothetical protein IKT47_09340, partial [Oscillospiraceae bacterium]|nr:hypothetical protein [Oscillospiraceae bacterium]